MTTVYYTSSLVPEELIAACGCRPQRLTAGSDTNGFTAQTEGMCGYTKVWLDTLLAKAAREPFAAVFATSCDQMRRGFELFAGRTGKHAFLLNAPATATPQARDYFRLELQRLQDFLCSVSGTGCDERLLRQSLSKPPSQPGSATTRRYRIGFIGEAVPETIRRRIDEILSQADIEVALDLTGEPADTEATPCTLQADPLTILADRLISRPSIRQRPNTPFYRILTEQFTDADLDGVILARYVFCDLWHAAVYELKRRLPIPVLAIDLDGSGHLPASALSRLQAFGEMLTP